MGAIEEVLYASTGLAIRFRPTVKVSTLTNENITLYENQSTPIASPFQTINTVYDYNSISRVLHLRYATQLQMDTPYELRVDNLLDGAGQMIPSDSRDFMYEFTEDPTPPAPRPPIEIIDHSIKSRAFIASETIVASNPDFYIVDTIPENFELYVADDENKGRVTIKFSSAPDPSFLNKKYFKAQRKKVQRAPSRWEDVAVRVSLDSSRPWVYVDFPSQDATPVYVKGNKIYFEEGYKYRVRISKEVGY